MTIPLTGTGSFGSIIGAIFGNIDDVNAFRGNTAGTRVTGNAVLASRYSEFVTQFAGASPVLIPTLDGWEATVNSQIGAQGGYLTALQTLAQNTLIQMVNNDSAGAAQDVPSAMRYLINQMEINTTTVNASSASLGAQTVVGSAVGDPVIVGSVDDIYGRQLAYAIPETLTWVCTQDVNGGATKFQEQLSFSGPAVVSDSLSFLWPGGSGATGTLTCVDFAVYNSEGGANLLENGDFLTFTHSNVPDNWTVVTGTPGTDILKGSTSNAIRAVNSLEIIGDGSTLHSITQSFNTTPSTALAGGGTAAVLTANQQIAVNFWLKAAGTTLAAGVLKVDLIDGSSTVINDDSGNPNSVTINFGSIATSLTNFSAVFRLPASVPSTVKLRFHETTAFTSGADVCLSGVAAATMTQIYAGGPSFTVFAADAAPNATGLLPDTWTLAVNNTYSKWQKHLDAVFGMRTLGLQVPQTGSSPTLADSLVA